MHAINSYSDLQRRIPSLSYNNAPSLNHSIFTSSTLNPRFSMSCAISDADLTLPVLLLKALSLIEAYQYVLALLVFALIFAYNFLEVHFVGDAVRGFRGDRAALTFDPESEIYEGVVSKCGILLHGRYLPTQWLASPHLQTAFLNYFGRAPSLCYRRQLYTLHDGGTVALDWLLASDAAGDSYDSGRVISKDDSTPLVIAIPGLTSDSSASYMRHLVHGITKQGWNVVVLNHRGLGGVSITSDWFYNAGWTNDVRELFYYLHQEYPKSPLFAIGTSIGANVLVKYLGEEGDNTPLAGASAICSPWDLLVCDRFINRKFIQRLYNRTLATGLKGYAQLHQAVYSRLGNWDGILSSRSVREFDNHATCIIGKFETADAYYRFATSTSYLKGVSIPLLCVSALDDPVCTREAIPWDECKVNKNIVLATVPHGGHLAFFEGLTARSLWWVGAVSEFLSVLHSSPYMHRQQQIESTGVHSPLESSIGKSPYVNLREDGLVAAVSCDEADNNKSMTSIDSKTTHNSIGEGNEDGTENEHNPSS